MRHGLLFLFLFPLFLKENTAVKSSLYCTVCFFYHKFFQIKRLKLHKVFKLLLLKFPKGHFAKHRRLGSNVINKSGVFMCDHVAAFMSAISKKNNFRID